MTEEAGASGPREEQACRGNESTSLLVGLDEDECNDLRNAASQQDKLRLEASLTIIRELKQRYLVSNTRKHRDEVGRFTVESLSGIAPREVRLLRNRVGQYLQAFKGGEPESVFAKRRFAAKVNALVHEFSHELACPKCKRPGLLRVSSKGSFQFRHNLPRLKTDHAGSVRVPELVPVTIKPKPR